MELAESMAEKLHGFRVYHPDDRTRLVLMHHVANLKRFGLMEASTGQNSEAFQSSQLHVHRDSDSIFCVMYMFLL